MSGSSYRTILRSSSIIGGAQVANVFAGLAKMKVVAILFGPAGVGLVGIYVNLMQAAASVLVAGIGSAGSRQVAVANADGTDIDVGRARRAVMWGGLGLGLLASLIFWLASPWITRVVVGDENRSLDVALLSLGVGLTVIAGTQTAVLIGLSRVGDMARVGVSASASASILGVLALWLWPSHGLVIMILLMPALASLFGYRYMRRLGPPQGPKIRFSELLDEWRPMVHVGVASLVAGLAALVGPLLVRTFVQHELGDEPLGQFQAAWAISMTYLGFVFAAMGADYYPRLAAALSDRAAAAKLVNEQTEVALLLCAPVLLAMLAFAPAVIHLLYSAEFGPAVEILRWQLIGDVLKVMSWPLGFVLVAMAATKTYILTETVGMAVFVLGVYFGLPLLGLRATGIAFLVLYMVYLPMVYLLAGRRLDGFRWTKAVRMQAVVVIFAAVIVDAVSRMSNVFGAWLGGAAAVLMGIWALVRLARKTDVGGRLGRFAGMVGQLTDRISSRGGRND